MQKAGSAAVMLCILSVICSGCVSGSDRKMPEPLAVSAETENGDTPLVVGYSEFSQKFSPYYADTGYDQDAVSMTQVSLLTTDRAGRIIYDAIEGETIPWQGTDYTYTGIADLSVEYDEAADQTVYTARLRDDIVFSDGTPMTADDLIFNYYVYLDTSYVGSETLNSYDIVGLQNYRNNSTAAEGVEINQDEIAAELIHPDDETVQYIKTMIEDILNEEMRWCEENYEAYGAESKEAFFTECYNLDESFVYEGKSYEEIGEEIKAQYGSGYRVLALNYAGDETYFDGLIQSFVRDKLEKEAIENTKGQPVDSISGIKKIDDYTVSVTTYGYEAPAVYAIFGIAVAPLHYYGDPLLYDYENNRFGFERGNYQLEAEKATHPVGAGPYEFVKYTNKTIYYRANENYYKGTPKISEVQFREVGASEVTAGVQTGTIDCAALAATKERFAEVMSYNSNHELSGNVITMIRNYNPGYGYIGINAANVNVGGDPASEASVNLRKGLATILAAYRDTAVDSYYGEAASVINYPVSNTSWAAPRITDQGYRTAFSKDVNGNDIYSSDMSTEQRYDAAKEAALGYFMAAGYIVEDGRISGVPSGAKSGYEVIIPGGGAGDHPAFAILTDAQAALAEIGITLKINDPADANVLWDSIDANTHELWCAAWGAGIDPDMYQVYHSQNVTGGGGTDSNHYHITDSVLDAMILEARASDSRSIRKEIYQKAFDIIMDWAVEIPVYQRQNCMIFSTERIAMETVTPDTTTFYGWMAEIENMEMN